MIDSPVPLEIVCTPLCCWHDIGSTYLGWTLEHCCWHGQYRWGCHAQGDRHGPFAVWPSSDALERLMEPHKNRASTVE